MYTYLIEEEGGLRERERRRGGEEERGRMYTYLIEEEGGLRVEADDSGEVLVVCQESHQQTEEHCTNLLVLGGERKGRDGEGRGGG